jgi:hypothetical protein
MRVTDQFQDQAPGRPQKYEPRTRPRFRTGKIHRLPQSSDATVAGRLDSIVKVVDVESKMMAAGLIRPGHAATRCGRIVLKQLYFQFAQTQHHNTVKRAAGRRAAVGAMSVKETRTQHLYKESAGGVGIRDSQPDMIDSANRISKFYSHTRPPLTPTTTPVTCPDRGDTRYSSVEAISSGEAILGTA